MNQYLIIGAVAGLCTALLNLSGYMGGVIGLGFILVLLSSLPIMIASFGWGSYTGLIAAITAGVALTFLVSLQAGLLFLALNSLPAWWLSHLLTLSRTNSETGEQVWYPLDRLLMWIAGFASIATMAMFIPFGFSLETYQDAIATLMKEVYKAQKLAGPNGPALNLDTLVAFVSRLAPTASAIMLVISAVATLYLAGKIAKKSDRLSRPWPDLHQVTMPTAGAIVFLIGLAAAFLGGLAGIFAQIVASAYGAALLLVGLSVLHYLTRSSPSRIFLLWTTYFLLVVFGWIGLFLIILGAGEVLINIRSRYSKPPKPGNDAQNGSHS